MGSFIGYFKMIFFYIYIVDLFLGYQSVLRVFVYLFICAASNTQMHTYNYNKD